MVGDEFTSELPREPITSLVSLGAMAHSTRRVYWLQPLYFLDIRARRQSHCGALQQPII